MAFRLSCGALALVIGCASGGQLHDAPAEPGPDPVIESFRARALPFTPSASGFSAGAATLPGRASDGVRVGGITLHDDALGTAAAVVDRRGVVYRNAHAESIWLAMGSGVEELRVLRYPQRVSTARWRFDADARVVGDHIEVGDVRCAAIVAIDARGIRRPVELQPLNAREIEATVRTDDLTFPVVIDPLWTTTSAMTSTHWSHASVLLTTGDVIISPASYRGVGPLDPYGQTQLWDSKTATFSLLSPSSLHPSGGIAALPGGRALLFGGWATPWTAGVLSTAEIFDVSTKTWAATGSMSQARREMGVARLASGVVLSAGGRTFDDTSPAVTITEAFNPSTGTWALRAPMKNARWAPAVAVLSTGKVLVVGGLTQTGMSSASELYDPATDTWSDAGVAPSDGISFPMVPVSLPGGRAIVTGKFAYVFDSATNAWKATASPTVGGSNAAAALLSNGLVLVAGGQVDGGGTTSAAELWDPSSGLWTATSPMGGQRLDHRATLLPDGRVLITGGRLGVTPLSTAELYSPLSNGEKCASGIECRSGICVDAVCCDAKCAEPCRACTVAGSLGTCSPVTGSPVGARTCAPFKTCTAGACDMTCKADVDCALETYCGGACTPRKPNGATCARPRECTSNFCADGVCCNSGCGNVCEACDATGSVGTCTAIKGAPHGARAKCDLGTGVCSARACDGTIVATCSAFSAAAGAPCKTAACAESRFFKASTCDGAGACKDDEGTSCTPFNCSTAGCKTTCANNDDCATGFACRAGKCEQGSARCTSDGKGSIGLDGVVTSCKGFLCGPAGTCLNACGTSAECAGGYTCDVASKACVAPQAEDSGCSYGGSSRGGSVWLLAGVILLLRRRQVLAAMAATLACSPGKSSESAREALFELSAIVETAPGITREPLRLGERGLVARTKGALPASAPMFADEAMHVGRDVWLELAAAGTSGKQGRTIDSAIVFQQALAGVDLVYTVTPDRIEQVWIARTAAPRIHLGETIRTSAGSRVRIDGDRLELVDASSVVRLRSERIVAIDAAGRRRTPLVSIEGDSLHLTLDTEGLSFPVVIDPAFAAVPAMSTARAYGSATKLADGSVLFAGGIPSFSSEAVSTAERFLPATKTWAPPSTMTSRRRDHAAVVMSTGRVLVAGGQIDFAAISTAEIFDPATGSWTATASLKAPAAYNALVAIPKGALHVGSGGPEVFDAAAGTFSNAGTMITAGRTHFGAAKLPSGKVLVAGGRIPGPAVTSEAEIYDPTTNSWSSTTPLSVPRAAHATVTLASGKILVLGGSDAGESSVKFGEVYDEATRTWVKTAPMPEITAFGGTVIPAVLSDGRVLVGPGQVTKVATQVWFPTRDQWSVMSPMGWSPSGVVALDTGRALIAGGIATTPTANYATSAAELFEPLANATSCPGDGDCASGYCVDGICCDRACDKLCEKCNAPGSIGTCSAVTGAPDSKRGTCSPYLCSAGACATTCATDAACIGGTICEGATCGPKLERGRACSGDSRCASGHCVDGLCCDSACTDVCAACDVPGREGACSPVAGAPHGARKCTDTSMGEPCRAPSCDGTKDTKSCVAVPSAATTCGASKCAGDALTPTPRCNGGGACVTPETVSCKPYRCSDAGCLTTCSASQPCAEGFNCVADRCLPGSKKAECTPDKLSSVGVDTVVRSCGAYRCVESGLCGTSCSSTVECNTGFICEPRDNACVSNAAPPATDESGGCSMAPGEKRRGGSLVVAVVVLFFLRRRRTQLSRRSVSE